VKHLEFGAAGESLDCALSFFVKSGIPIVASDNHHTFTFFQYLQNGNRDASRDLLLLQTGQRREKIQHKLSDVYGKDSYSLGAVKYWGAVPNLRRRELTFMMKFDPGDP
jgi:hypothetical protein